ncbi:hypothetical protein DSS3P8_054 [Roseobacter phage DSS3P8]|nr:hypothetical protein DSS3P8_054 [Roseobacter phage DSS3P8]
MIWSLLMSSVSASAVVAGGIPTPSALDFSTAFATFTPAAGWGMVRRNDSYSGPACRVRDNANPGTFVDIYFDVDGYVTDAIPYGANTRVSILYDQFGTEDLVETGNVSVKANDGTFPTWRLSFIDNNGHLESTSTVADTPSWAINTPLWGANIVRPVDAAGLRNVFGVEGDITYMVYGLWLDGPDLHWRVNGLGATDWADTDWTLNPEVQGTLSSLVSDAAPGGSNAYHNGIKASTIAENPYPILDFSLSTAKLGLGGWSGLANNATVDIIELTVFDGVTMGYYDRLNLIEKLMLVDGTGLPTYAEKFPTDFVLGDAESGSTSISPWLNDSGSIQTVTTSYGIGPYEGLRFFSSAIAAPRSMWQTIAVPTALGGLVDYGMTAEVSFQISSPAAPDVHCIHVNATFEDAYGNPIAGRYSRRFAATTTNTWEAQTAFIPIPVGARVVTVYFEYYQRLAASRTNIDAISVAWVSNPDEVSADRSRTYAVLGASPNAVNVQRQRTYAVFGRHPEILAVNQHRTYVILE